VLVGIGEGITGNPDKRDHAPEALCVQVTAHPMMFLRNDRREGPPTDDRHRQKWTPIRPDPNIQDLDDGLMGQPRADARRVLEALNRPNLKAL
jgi:hypothetical protein